MNCYACANEATSQCKRCGRPYCDAHGDALCAECLKPASALPSYTLYRGSLLALLVGTAFALYGLGSKMGPKLTKVGGKLTTYACGEDFPVAENTVFRMKDDMSVFGDIINRQCSDTDSQDIC